MREVIVDTSNCITNRMLFGLDYLALAITLKLEHHMTTVSS